LAISLRDGDAPSHPSCRRHGSLGPSWTKATRSLTKPGVSSGCCEVDIGNLSISSNNGNVDSKLRNSERMSQARSGNRCHVLAPLFGHGAHGCSCAIDQKHRSAYCTAHSSLLICTPRRGGVVGDYRYLNERLDRERNARRRPQAARTNDIELRLRCRGIPPSVHWFDESEAIGGSTLLNRSHTRLTGAGSDIGAKTGRRDDGERHDHDAQSLQTWSTLGIHPAPNQLGIGHHIIRGHNSQD